MEKITGYNPGYKGIKTQYHITKEPMTNFVSGGIQYDKQTWDSYKYKLIDPKDKYVMGEMIATKYPDYLYIDSLKINNKRQGLGSTLINYAKNESKKMGYGGRLSLLSSNAYDHKNPPHVFYRKQGFQTSSRLLNRILDLCIKLNLKGKLLKNDIKMFIV